MEVIDPGDNPVIQTRVGQVFYVGNGSSDQPFLDVGSTVIARDHLRHYVDHIYPLPDFIVSKCGKNGLAAFLGEGVQD